MHGYIPKDKLKTDCSTGQNGDKKISNNYVDVTVATTQENSETEIIGMCIVPVKIRHWKNIKNRWVTQSWIVATKFLHTGRPDKGVATIRKKNNTQPENLEW